MFDLERLALLVEAPRSVRPSLAQLEVLRVLADEWIEESRPAGLWLAEMLQGHLTAARLDALGFGDWGVEQDPRYIALSLAPDFAASCAALAARGELNTAIRVLAWSGHADDSALHPLVAEHLRGLLTRVEHRTLKVVSRQDCRFWLENQCSAMREAT